MTSTLSPVTIGANDATIKNSPISYRLLAMIPSRSRQVAERASKDWHAKRNKEITHDAMRVLLTKLKGFLERKIVMLFADGKYRNAWPYLDFLNMDGAEVAAHTLLSCHECPVCDVPRMEMANTDRPLQLRTSQTVFRVFTKMSRNYFFRIETSVINFFSDYTSLRKHTKYTSFRISCMCDLCC